PAARGAAGGGAALPPEGRGEGSAETGSSGFYPDAFVFKKAKRTEPFGAQGIEAEILADFAQQNPLDWSG
ncbi:MAG: hypothetical protein LBC67_00180, partial [Spirochaetales bacterium]|nr:hypothetical protein [Spirochaetales bacterium]